MTDSIPPSLPPSSGSNEKLWIVLCHLSLLLGVGFLLPLIVFLVKKQDAPLTAEHAKEALNFHISIVLYLIISFVLLTVLIGFVTFAAVIIIGLVFPIIACIKASNGEFYRYPLTIRLVK